MRRPSRRVTIALVVVPLLAAVPAVGLLTRDPATGTRAPIAGDGCGSSQVDDRTTTAAPGRADSATPSDAAPAVEVGTPLRLAWSDEFDGAELDPARWADRECWNGTPGFHNDSDAWLPYPATATNLDVDEGSLLLKARRGGAPADSGRDMTTAMLTSRDSYSSFTSGVVEARLKLPSGKGLWPAFWLMGNGVGERGWPETGEIDIFEFVNNNAGGTGRMYSSVHWGDIAGGSITAHHVASKNAALPWWGDDRFHTFSLHRTADFLRFYVDGEQVMEILPGEAVPSYPTPVPVGGPLFEDPMHIRLSLEVGGDWAGQGYSADQYEPGDFVVDYVRAWDDPSAADPSTQESVNPA